MVCDHALAQSLSRVQLFVTPWTVVPQAPLSMGFPRQEYWSGLPSAPPGDLPWRGIKPASPALASRQILSHCSTGRPGFVIYSLYCAEVCFFLVQDPQAGEPDLGLRTRFCRRSSGTYSQRVGQRSSGGHETLHCASSPPPHLVVAPSLHL